MGALFFRLVLDPHSHALAVDYSIRQAKLQRQLMAVTLELWLGERLDKWEWEKGATEWKGVGNSSWWFMCAHTSVYNMHRSIHECKFNYWYINVILIILHHISQYHAHIPLYVNVQFISIIVCAIPMQPLSVLMQYAAVIQYLICSSICQSNSTSTSERYLTLTEMF